MLKKSKKQGEWERERGSGFVVGLFVNNIILSNVNSWFISYSWANYFVHTDTDHLLVSLVINFILSSILFEFYTNSFIKVEDFLNKIQQASSIVVKVILLESARNMFFKIYFAFAFPFLFRQAAERFLVVNLF